MTLRQLERRCRRALYSELAPRFEGTREALRRAIRRAVRGTTGPMRANVAWMLRVVREARFAALVAGAVLATGLAGSAGAAPIELSDIADGVGTDGFVINGIDTDDVGPLKIGEV